MREHIPDKSIDLVYLDPPFGTGKNWGAFDDRWSLDNHHNDLQDLDGHHVLGPVFEGLRLIIGEGSRLAYLAFMANRLLECHRVLQDTGSIYLHCDSTASHYLKMVMDSIFGPQNFRNEVIWSYRRYTARSNRFQREHDVILFYSGKLPVFNVIYDPYAKGSGKEDSHYKKGEDGKWFRWQKRRGQEPYKVYLSEGRRANDVWQIPHINSSSYERLGYPTQKPLALLERIIKASSNEGDVVLDPFCGCATTIEAAHKLGRPWIGIDVSEEAIGIATERLRQEQHLARSS